MPGTIRIDCHGATDVGRKRQSNQDQFLVADLAKTMLVTHSSLSLDDRTRIWSPVQGKLMVVADGMGGHQAGEQASDVALRAVTSYALHIMPWFFRLDEQRDDVLQDELRTALEKADMAVNDEAGASQHRGMGTTLTMAYVLWPHLYVVHAGDSRCYLLRGGELHRITRDHTLAQKLVDDGVLEQQRADESRFAHVLVNAVIAHDSVDLEPEVSSLELAVGDQLLLCSDGLSGPVGDDEILAVLQHSASAERACQSLIERANDGGGPDNVTAVVARFSAG